MDYNTSPISLRQGQILIDGVVCADGISAEINFTPDVWSGKQVGDYTDSSRWLGYNITGTIGRRRSTPFLREKINAYKTTHKTPEMVLQGIMNDPESDYYEKYGSDVVTCVGVVLTGNLPLTRLDSGGEVVEDSISFNARDIV